LRNRRGERPKFGDGHFSPIPTVGCGADGSLFQLAVFGNGEPQIRFQWWSVPPPQWQPMVAIANEMIQGFLMAEGRSADECADWVE
jgi:hypothetical protein